ncbi:MAG: aminoacyl-tRNA hydrolase [Lachnospiraceae bacterium]|nr:aminoacyl-tRNA hydrolase [Lachnospiraceae bacterium]
MYLIAGLGNPGKKYAGTRHNMGFDVIDCLSEEYRIPLGAGRFHAMSGSGFIGDEKVLLLKPLTYMNLSGTAVQEALHYYRLDPETDLLVISDDIDLDVGRLRIRKKGSAGGQKGLAHIIQCIGTDAFPRVRIGTGAKPAGWELADWVLSTFPGEERKAIDDAVEKAAKACAVIVTEGVDAAMNRFNTKPVKKKAEKLLRPETAGADSGQEEHE